MHSNKLLRVSGALIIGWTLTASAANAASGTTTDTPSEVAEVNEALGDLTDPADTLAHYLEYKNSDVTQGTFTDYMYAKYHSQKQAAKAVLAIAIIAGVSGAIMLIYGLHMGAGAALGSLASDEADDDAERYSRIAIAGLVIGVVGLVMGPVAVGLQIHGGKGMTRLKDYRTLSTDDPAQSSPKQRSTSRPQFNLAPGLSLSWRF